MWYGKVLRLRLFQSLQRTSTFKSLILFYVQIDHFLISRLMFLKTVLGLIRLLLVIGVFGSEAGVQWREANARRMIWRCRDWKRDSSGKTGFPSFGSNQREPTEIIEMRWVALVLTTYTIVAEFPKANGLMVMTFACHAVISGARWC